MNTGTQRWRFWALATALIALMGSATARTSVVFSDVEATYHAGDPEHLKHTIDGRNASSTGWSVDGHFESPQSIVFTTEEAIEADLIELSLCFMSGRPHASFADFEVSYTIDETPTQEGNWEPLPLLNFSAATCELSRAFANRLTAYEVSFVVTGMIPDDIYRISTRLPGKAVTGFRITVYPVTRDMRPSDGPVMAWASTGDFMLTEFRVEVISTSTNVALGAPASATHPLHETNYPPYGQMMPGALTDGWPSTLAHPASGTPTEDFYFEIDLGQHRQLDHLGLRQRGDHYSLERFSQMRIKLYDEDPKTGAEPTWHAYNRPDGSYPPQGAVDILRASDGQGDFHGRYIRISSEMPHPRAPMLAEVEVYETRTPQLAAVMADGQGLSVDGTLQIPPGVQRLGFLFKIPQTGKPYDQLYRWKISEENKSWQISNELLLEIPCPPAGDFQLELQAAHSDGTWDATLLKLPFVVNAHFTQTPAFLWLIGSATLLVGVLSSRYGARLKIKRLEAHTALEAERSRIARNMHDDVGARLAQLTVLQDVFTLEHELPPAANTDLAALTGYTREAMSALDDAVWTVNPRNDTLPALAAYLIQNIDAYLSPLGITYRIDSPNEWPNIPLQAGTRHEVALAFKESLQNIVKHAAASEVAVKLRHTDGQFIIRVADNGRGFPAESTGPGQDGLINMRQRLQSIHGSCDWLPNENGGTIVEMKLPLS
ncbi:histidine kinase [Puniceicoccaceae bacterium]|nr:histidine kinase [Puniceicoccaceae bacterium]